MFKKIVTIIGFILIFALATALIFYMQNKMTASESETTVADITSEPNSADLVHYYNTENLEQDCQSDSEVFCAVERTVKCTINPELEICNKKFVPAFVLGKAEDTERPTKISFQITNPGLQPSLFS